MKLIIVCWLICLIQVLHSNQAQEEKSEEKWDVVSWFQELKENPEMAESGLQLAAPLIENVIRSPHMAFIGDLVSRGMRLADEQAAKNQIDSGEFNSLIANRQRPVVVTQSCPPTSLCTETSTTTDTTTTTSTSTTLSIETTTSTATITSSVTSTSTTTLTDTSTTTFTSSLTTTSTSSVTSTSSTTLTTTVTTVFNSTITTIVTVNLLTSFTRTITRTSYTTVTLPARAAIGVNEILAEWNDSPDLFDGDEKELLLKDLDNLDKYHMARIDSSKEVSDG